jgi:hypothetical protein
MTMSSTAAWDTGRGVNRGRVLTFVAIVALLGLTAWAATAGGREAADVQHLTPGTVEHVEGSDRAVVVLTAAGAEKIGLELTTVEQVSHRAGRFAVPHAALVHDADGTIWVYTSDDTSLGAELRFRRQLVEVAAVQGQRAILTRGPDVGTRVVGTGSAELYGTEFEVGH